VKFEENFARPMVFEGPFTTPNKDNPDGMNPCIPIQPGRDKPLLAWISSSACNLVFCTLFNF